MQLRLPAPALRANKAVSLCPWRTGEGAWHSTPRSWWSTTRSDARWTRPPDGPVPLQSSHPARPPGFPQQRRHPQVSPIVSYLARWAARAWSSSSTSSSTSGGVLGLTTVRSSRPSAAELHRKIWATLYASKLNLRDISCLIAGDHPAPTCWKHSGTGWRTGRRASIDIGHIHRARG